MDKNTAGLTAQEEFDKNYISSSEICAELNVSRATLVNARRRGILPDPIIVKPIQLYLWKRDEVRPYVDAWHFSLRARRGELAE